LDLQGLKVDVSFKKGAGQGKKIGTIMTNLGAKALRAHTRIMRYKSTQINK
jgi:hypothetical protein